MPNSYDAIIVGGGIAGSGLATVLARAGKSVLLLEKTSEFQDVVRGEWIAPWGVLDARKAGLLDTLLAANDHYLPYHIEYGDGIDPEAAVARKLDMTAFLPGVSGPLAIGHPQACQALFDAATAAGATTLRGVTDIAVEPGGSPCVTYSQDGATHVAHARLVVGADGRGSVVRRQAGIELQQDPTHHYFAGMLVEEVDGWPEDLQTMGTEGDVQFFVFPQGAGRSRLYLSFANEQKSRLAGSDNQQRFLDAFRLDTVPYADAITSARPAGPCHTIPNQSTWVDKPVAPGIVLIGDAAGYNDPIIGQGLAVSLRDVRIVSELLLAAGDWSDATLAPYAEERAERMRRLRFSAAFDSFVHAEFGPDATARKLRILERSAADPTFAMCRAAVMVGPELMPPSAFTDEEWQKLTSV
jgi:2-polyprenyl-6-methoxyphenol hydroxylase-like FAD-dependent oxidoreductase